MLKLLRWRGSRSVHGLRHVLSHEIRRSHNALPVRSYTSAISPALTQQAAVAPRDTSPGLPSKGITLRNYQLESIEAVLKAFEDGKRQVGVSLATGSGKTVIFTELIERVIPPAPGATRALILVHRRELVEQAARQCSLRYPSKKVEIEMGNLRASGKADITVASIQSIHSQDRIDKFDPEEYKLILVDEAHHIVSSAYLKVLQHFGIPEAKEGMKSTPALVGVSATMSRLDGLALGKVIKHIVYHKDYIDMIGERWLSDVIFTTVSSTADLSKVGKGVGGDFQTSQLSKAVNQERINLITIKAWQHRCSDRKSTLVFCVDLDHVDKLTAAFRQQGVDARFITGNTLKKIRSERLDAFKRGEYPVLVNCGVFTEGTDVPNIDCVILARPTRSKNLLVQMIGRGMRLHAGKKNCHIIDMVASLQTGIVTTPTLFGLDPSETISGKDPEELRRMQVQREKLKRNKEVENLAASAVVKVAAPSTGDITFTDYDNLADLIEDSSGERLIRKISPNAWVNVGPDRYILVNGGIGDYLTIQRDTGVHAKVTDATDSPGTEARGSIAGTPEESTWVVVLTPKAPKVRAFAGKAPPPFYRNRTLLQATSFDAAVQGADTYASTKFLRFYTSLFLPGKNWRNQPASQAQVSFINKYREEGKKLDPGSITKGRVGDMITKIKFGAKGRVLGVLKQRKKEEKAREKMQDFQKMVEREKVRVGPVMG